MNRRLAGLLGVASGLIAIIAWEIAHAPQDDVMALRPRMATPSPPAAPNADHTSSWVTAILARPLFSPDRRPASDAAIVEGAGPSGLPRLTAILIGPFGRSAIFANGGGKSVVVAEGGRIEAYTIKSIEAEQVRLLGPDGASVLHPTFDAASAKSGTTAAPPRRLGQAALPR